MRAARELSARGYRVLTVVGGIQAYKGRNTESYTGKNIDSGERAY